MKVVFVAINGIGLGHLNRTRQIARALRERDPSVDIVFVTNSIKPEFVAQDGFTVLRPFLPFDPTRELRAAWLATSNAVLEAILLAQQPDVIVYDYLYWRGLLARVAKKLAARQVLVLRHRVGKSARRLVKRETRRALVDLLVVPHRKDDFDATGMPAAFVERLAFVGEVAAPRATAAECDAVRDRYGIAKDTRLVVVSPGGGGADECATFFREALTAAVRVARERRDVKIVAISGPLRAPESLASAQDVLTIVPFEPAMTALTGAADAMIALAGYNTTQEILASRTRAVLVPKLEGRDDQVARVRKLAQAGLVLEGAQDADRLERALHAAFGDEGDRVRGQLERLPAFDGARRAAAAIQAVGERAQPRLGHVVIGPRDAVEVAATALSRRGVDGATLLHVDERFVAALAAVVRADGAPARELRVPFKLLLKAARARVDGKANSLRRARAVRELLRTLRAAGAPALRIVVHDEDGRALARYPMPWLAVVREGVAPK